MSVTFEQLGFHTEYEVEVDPEFPPAGDWGQAVQHFHRDVRCDGGEPFWSVWGPPMIARIWPYGADDWIAMAEAGGLHHFSGIFAGPSSKTLLMVNGGCAYVVDVINPEAYSTVALSGPVTGVSALPAAGLLLLATFSELAAVDRDGLLWTSERLVLDDLCIIDASTDAIRVTGSTIEGVTATTEVDPITGAILKGEWLVPEQIRYPPRWHRLGT